MKVLFRTDASSQIGGGHMMRCLALADAMREKGHDAAFVMAQTDLDWSMTVRLAGYTVYPVVPAPREHDPEGPVHQDWLPAPWADDAAVTARAVADFVPDWLVWDHYGLDARWVNAVRSSSDIPAVMAIDDLDDRPLGSEFVLDQTCLVPAPRRNPALVSLTGPRFATLRPEFSRLRAAKVSRPVRQGSQTRVLVTLGLADSAALVPDIARVLASLSGLSVDIVMGKHAQTLTLVKAICDSHPNFTLHVDTPEMASLMCRADLCIGAGGMTSWERCCLGLATLLIPVADNQFPVAKALEAAGAVQVLPLSLARDPLQVRLAVQNALAAAPKMAQIASELCDGGGAARVVQSLAGNLRPVCADDAKMLFDWRNQPHIRAVSLTADPLEWQAHIQWVAHAAAQKNGVWWIYSEGGTPLGHINARQGQNNDWRWGFYIGASDAPRGAGRRMLARALSQLLKRPDCRTIEAEIRADNLKSISLHKQFGFWQTQLRGDGAILVFSLAECEMCKMFSIRQLKELPE